MTNFIIQTLLGLPTFCLVVLLLHSAFYRRKFRINNFFLYGNCLAVIQFISNGLFWSGEPTTSSLANYSKISILFSPVLVLFLYGLLQTTLRDNPSTKSDKQSILILAILSLITFGFYVPYWYVEKYEMNKKENLLVVLFALFLAYSFFLHIYLYADSNAFGLAIWLSIDLITIILGIALALNLRTIILTKSPKAEINPVLTLLLGIFYLQYKINQLDNI